LGVKLFVILAKLIVLVVVGWVERSKTQPIIVGTHTSTQPTSWIAQ